MAASWQSTSCCTRSRGKASPAPRMLPLSDASRNSTPRSDVVLRSDVCGRRQHSHRVDAVSARILSLPKPSLHMPLGNRRLLCHLASADET